MIYNLQFIDYATKHNQDISYNVGSQYYNSRETRIAYYRYIGDIS
jgi:hypothetical protein